METVRARAVGGLFLRHGSGGDDFGGYRPPLPVHFLSAVLRGWGIGQGQVVRLAGLEL